MGTQIEAVRGAFVAAYAALSVDELNEMIAEPFVSLRSELLVPVAA